MIIFTEIINCAPVGKIMLESFHKYHDQSITVFCGEDDYGQLKEFHHLDTFIVQPDFVDLFKKGHAGTARIFANVIQPDMDLNVAHIDSDIVFKKESISLIENAFDEGYDIVGSRRCYKNNPGKVPVPDGIPDAVSTYFFGMKTKVLPKGYGFDQMAKMMEGHPIDINHTILDFFDPVYFHCLRNGAKTKFLDSDLVGGQDINGSKVNKYKSNLHLDMGEHLAHFGGCGSGYAVTHGISNMEKSYADWARARWALFSELFYDRFVAPYPLDMAAQFDDTNRWISGRHNDDILNLIKEDLSN